MIQMFFVLLLYQANGVVLSIHHHRKITKFRGSKITNTKYCNNGSYIYCSFTHLCSRHHSSQNQFQAGAEKIRWNERKLLLDHECLKEWELNKIFTSISQISQCYVFFRYTLAGILQHWLEYFCKLTVDFRYTLPRILQEWLEYFCK